MIGDFLYGLTPRDAGAPLLAPFYTRRQLTAAAAIVSVAFQVPPGYVLVLGGVLIGAVAGAAQTTTSVQSVVTTPDGVSTVTVLAGSGTIAAAAGVNTIIRADLEHTLIDPRGMSLRASANFSAGAAANTVTAYAWGILIPTGNLQIGVTDIT